MNPFITKDQADYNMVKNLANTKSITSALVAKLVLKMFNRFGIKESNMDSYLIAKNKVLELGYINPVMDFTPYNFEI